MAAARGCRDHRNREHQHRIAHRTRGAARLGAKTATRIVEYRQKNGPFKKIEELMNVRGVGEKNFLKLKPQITVTAKAEGAAAAK